MASRGKYGDKGGEIWYPEIIDASSEVGWNRVSELKKAPDIDVYDNINTQLFEYFKLQQPSAPPTAADVAEKIDHLLQEQKIASVDRLGNWAFYPWCSKLVHVLPETLFASVRTDRNRNKITAKEQVYLYSKKVGVIGMSVGRSVATTMALERIFGELRLADFDVLDLSNLNRLKAPLWDLGLRKTVSVARDIFETDPYLKLKLFHDGITGDNIDAFGAEDGKLDVIVDECDSLEIKILCREYARQNRIPVVMETSDRGMLDIERFDLDHERPLFHGLLEGFDIRQALKDPEQKWKMLMTLVDFNNLSEKARISLPEIGKTLSTWPQLASSVVLGGGTVTDTVRRILLGERVDSGRYYIDVQETTAVHMKEEEG